MVSALDSDASAQGWSPGQGQCVVFLAKTLYSDGALSTKVYKWVPANLVLGVNLRWNSTSSRGSRNTLSRFILRKAG